jgi:hypothetical protein
MAREVGGEIVQGALDLGIEGEAAGLGAKCGEEDTAEFVAGEEL